MSLLQVLGLRRSADQPAAAPPRKAVRFEAVTQQVPKSGAGAVRIGAGRARSGAVIQPPPKVQKAVEVARPDGKKLEVVKTASGRVQYVAPPPKVGEVTFSGGGGKGTALPGAVKALHESGVLKDASKISGASVGSMTAALVAAGITPDEFVAVADADEATAAITEGTGGTKKGLLARAMKNKVTTGDGSPLTGMGLEGIVRDVLDETLRKRMTEYMAECGKAGKAPDPAVERIARKLASNKAGPTFGDFRALSKVIPAIKEVVMTGTYTTEFSTEKQDFEAQKKDEAKHAADLAAGRKVAPRKAKELKHGNQEGQLYVFDADSEPDMEVAVAVHASASFPGAFKPVDIRISSGLTVRFIDGGVMNNTPTAASLGNERDLDPVPQQRGVTFLFEDEGGAAASMLKGRVDPAQGLGARIADWFVGSNNAAAEYAKNRSAAARPGELVVVPLQIDLPPAKPGGKGQHYDMRGTFGGTLNFSPPKSVRDGLRAKTEAETRKQIAADAQPRKLEFASDAQMFVSIPLADLQALAAGGYEGAPAAVTFRERVAEMIGKLRSGAQAAAAKGRAAEALLDKDVLLALEELDRLAGSEAEFQRYVGRELNKKPDLDLLLEEARRNNRSGAGRKSPTMDAADEVAEGMRARTFADNILKQLVYPKMKHEPEGGAGILTLLTIEQLLLTAKSPTDVNQAIDLGVKHFRNKSDRRIPKRGHRRFAQQLDQRRMRPAA
ncbi:MAG: patatin-like phospholipase family protein [Piscinibacter sp.]|nr:patatin-like phospholipase family protein [Piscinibacter sp.]